MTSDDTATVYSGLPLTLEDDFRLVEIQPGDATDVVCCSLFSTRVRHAPKYEALSYTWGNTAEKQSIRCQNAARDGTGRLLVTQNCAAALRRLRLKDSSRTVWIDSICIDQSQDTEKTHQLGLMAQIYAQAEQVVIYLGDSYDDSDSAMDCICQIDDPDFNYEPSPWTSARQVMRPETQMLESLMSRPWFNRIWVLQEAVLSKSAVVYCGQKTASWDAFKHFKHFNISEKWLERLPHVIGRRLINIDDREAVEFQVLREMLQARNCESTDPRDKVYALLPLLSQSGLNPGIIPNYSHSITRVFTDVATYFTSCIGLELLCAACGCSNLPGLPSWVPDWSIRIQRRILGLNRKERNQSKFRHFRAGGKFVIPGRSKRHGVPTFTIDRMDQNGTFSAHLRTKGFRLGKITGIGDLCADDAEFPPFREWKDVASTIAFVVDTTQETQNQDHQAESEPGGTTLKDERREKLTSSVREPSKPIICSNSVSTLSLNDAQYGNSGDLFEYTITTGDVCDYLTVTNAVEEFITGDGTESSEITIREWMKCLGPSTEWQVERIINACRGRRFFVTDTKFMGLAPLETESGDLLLIIPGISVPFVFREEDEGLRLVGECYVQNVMDGEVIDQLNASRHEFEDFKII